MQPACEIVVQNILPVIRSEIAIELYKKHKLSQQEIAKLMNLTQSGVSRYLSQSRGKFLLSKRSREWNEFISNYAKLLIKGASPKEISSAFCEICKYCRKSKLICKFHPPKKGSDCSVCLIKMECD